MWARNCVIFPGGRSWFHFALLRCLAAPICVISPAISRRNLRNFITWGSARVTRTSLARINERQPYTLYEALFHKLLSRCHGVAPKHGFRFNNKLDSLDSTIIDLCLSVFPWANFRQTEGAVKVHVGLDHDGLLPSFVTVTDGKTHDITIGRTLSLPAESIVVADRAYTDYTWFDALDEKGVFFVTRQKRNAA